MQPAAHELELYTVYLRQLVTAYEVRSTASSVGLIQGYAGRFEIGIGIGIGLGLGLGLGRCLVP